MADTPVWLWSADASRILWGNAAAAAIFNAASSVALTGHTIDPKGSAALQIARLAGTLPHGAAPRLERLRGFGGRLGGALMCGCSRISLADRTPAILVVATEAAGRGCRWPTRPQRLLAGGGEPLALFAADGPAAVGDAVRARSSRPRRRTSPRCARGALGATALAAGRAEGEHGGGKFSIARIGADASTVLLVAFADATGGGKAGAGRTSGQAAGPGRSGAEARQTSCARRRDHRASPAAAACQAAAVPPPPQPPPRKIRRPSRPARAPQPAAAAPPMWRSGVSRFASSGRWTTAAASPPAPTNSSR